MHRRLTFFVSLLFLAGLISCHPSQDVPQAKQGLLDLRSWSWEKSGEIALDGEWLFYWKEFLSPYLPPSNQVSHTSLAKVPGVWSSKHNNDQPLSGTGYATYRLKVLLPADSVPLSLRINTASTAMQIWVNGEEIYEAGTVATSASEATPEFKPSVVMIPFSSTLDIVIHLSNYHYRKGGLWDFLMLGPHRVISQHWIRDYIITFFLVGSFIIIALYHLTLYLYRTSDPSPLYFSIFCLLIVVRTLSTDLYIIANFLPWNWVIRSELLSFYWCVPVFLAFTFAVYPGVMPAVIRRIVFTVTAVFSAVVLLLPTRWSTYTVIPFEVFAIVLCLYGFYKILTTRWRYRDNFSIFLLGLLCLFITLVNDSLHANNLISTFFMAPFGLFLFLFFQSALLSRRFSQTANVLEKINIHLEKKNQQIKEKNDALTKLNQEMDIFVYRTSHDLRAPLTSLLGIISLMRAQTISTEIIYYLDLQEKSIHKLDGFIREILDYSRNSRLAIEPQAVNFQKVVEETYSLYTHLPQFDKIEKLTVVNQTVPFGGDRKRLEVIFNNLISNALRYYNPYEENPYVQIEVDINETQAIVQVKDNGLGIAPQHQERIFEMFYRASTNSEGSGLGLFLVKETIEKIGGNVKIQSEVNKGTLFTVRLPNQTVMNEVAVE